MKKFTPRAYKALALKKSTDGIKPFFESLINNLADKTTVGDGTLVNNWYFEEGSPSTAFDDGLSGSGKVMSKRELKKIEDISPKTKSFFITNNAPYGRTVEYGIGDRSPRYFTRFSVESTLRKFK